MIIETANKIINKQCKSVMLDFLGATKYESRRENKFWATCHNISSLFDGY